MQKLAIPTTRWLPATDERDRTTSWLMLLKHYDEKGLVFYTNLSATINASN